MELKVSKLSKSFVGTVSAETTPVLRDVSFTAHEGRFICVIGPSGCGKTTLLRLLSGLEKPDSGRIMLGEREIVSPGNHIGYIFQESTLLPWRTVLGNVEFGLEVAGMSVRERREKAFSYIKMVELEGAENLYPKELSGGMKQRAALAVSLVVDPRVLLMDEPFAALDSQTRNNMQEALLQIWGKMRKTIILVTHNMDEAAFLADTIICLGPRPTGIEKILQVEMPRPRDRTGTELNMIRKEILAHISTSRQ
jgi:NitT/TauT family transport system ATP-binding protein